MTDAPYDWMQRLSQKARDAAERDMQSLRERAALSWPTEAVPAPVPFYWGDYDRLTGVAEPGAYWDLNAEIIHIRRKNDGDPTRTDWLFSRDEEGWTSMVWRGPLYRCRRDALIARRWRMCRDFAFKLAVLDEDIRRETKEPTND